MNSNFVGVIIKKMATKVDFNATVRQIGNFVDVWSVDVFITEWNHGIWQT